MDALECPSARCPTIREATATDDEVVASIVRTAYQHTGLPFREDAEDVARRRARGTVYVAEDGGRVVGTFTPSAFLAATVERFAVTPHHHRRGIGDAMASTLQGLAIAQGYYVLAGFSHSTMTAAHRLHEQLGTTANYLPHGIYYTLNLTAWG